MKLTKAEQLLIDGLREQGTTFEWNDIITLPNGAKSYTTRMNRNRDTYQGLHIKGLIRRATADEIAVWYAKHDAQTANIKRHLQHALDAGKWRVVGELAQTLQYRTGDNHPSNQEPDFFTLTEADPRLLVNVFAVQS